MEKQPCTNSQATNKAPRLAILGASGHGKVVADAALASKVWNEVVFYDDAYPGISSVGPWPVVGDTDDLVKQQSLYSGAIIAIGNNELRLSKLQYLQHHRCPIVSVIHPKAIVSPYASIGDGTAVLAGAVVNPFSQIGRACIVNSNAIVEHDCVLGDGVHLSPGSALAGNVKIGRRSWIGIATSVRQQISIGDDIIVGAGSTVVKDLFETGTYIGVPAMKFLNH